MPALGSSVFCRKALKRRWNASASAASAGASVCRTEEVGLASVRQLPRAKKTVGKLGGPHPHNDINVLKGMTYLR